YQHPAFRLQFDALTADVRKIRRTHNDDRYNVHPKVRLLARIRKLILDDIPRDPAASSYEIGNTMGQDYRHWRRAKFNQRFRLFFRFRSDAR
ncbi:MAG: type II toxin-antitoxin system YhaV family toxin, partial [Candidatus Velthaea sp.]